MKSVRYFLLTVLLLLAALPLQAQHRRDTLGVGSRINFTQNLGQWDSRIAFRSQMSLATLFLENDCFTIVLQHPDNDNLKHFPADFNQKGRYRQHAYRLHFVGCNATTPRGEERLNGYENFFIGNDPGHWASGVLSYQTVHYDELYDGVGLTVYSAKNALKYDFVVAPHADADRIVMQYEGIDGAKVKDGNIVVKTSVMDIVELQPYAYQIIDGKEVAVEAHYQLDNNTVRIVLGEYDHNRELIIDPYLYFSTYTGSTSDNWGTTGAYDSYKNTYTAGLVFGVGYPVSVGAYDGTYNGNADIGIFKFDTSGSQRLYATYLGGSSADMPHSMFVNSFDELIILGTTGSGDFPTTSGAYNTTFNGGTALQYEGSNTINYPNGSDLFIARFNSSGTQLQASTYIGGNGNDGLNYFTRFNASNAVIMEGNDSLYFNYGDGARGELITDDQNNIYVGSTTTSTNFPTSTNCVQPTNHGDQEGIVFKIDYNLSHLLWSSYFGGSGKDAIYSIDVDSSYNLLIAGGTTSEDLSTTAASYKTTYGGGSADGFVAKISRYGTQLMACSYYGSSAYDQCYFVRTGKKDDVFLFGQTKATGSTLIHNATYNTPGSGQFLARLSPNLDSLIWSTVFGSGRNTPDISPTAFAADICNRVYICGWGRMWAGYSFSGGSAIPWNTYGTSGLSVTSDAYQSTTDGQDFYIMSMLDDASQMIYGSFFGEPHSGSNMYSGHDHVDGGTSRFDRLATIYQSVCASCGGFDNFPTTTSAWSRLNNSSNCNNAIFRFNVANDFPVAEFLTPEVGCAPYTVHFRNTGRGNSYHWSFGDGIGSSTAAEPSYTYNTPGTYTITLVSYMENGCRATDTMTKQVLVLGHNRYNLDTVSTCMGLHMQIGVQPMLGCTYRWIRGAVSDSSISNPYVSASGVYTLVISNSACSDTIDQVVQWGHIGLTLSGDTAGCRSPMSLHMHADGNSGNNYVWSSHSNFSDTLGRTAEIYYDIQHPQWLYAHVSNQLGCESTDSIYIHFYSICNSLSLADPICPDSCNGTASAIITNYARPPILYNWGAGNTNDSVKRNLCSGSHTVTVTDANGCCITKTFTLSDPLGPTVNDSITHVKCMGECTGAIHLHIVGTSTYSLLWPDNGSTDTMRTGLCPGIYIVHITDANGCVYDYSFEVRDNADMNVQATLGHNTCPDACSGTASAQVTGGQTPYTYHWSNGETNATADELCKGNIIVIVTDSFGCSVSDTIFIDVQHSFDSIHAWADDSVVFGGESTTLHVTPIPNAGFSWTPRTGVASPTDSTTLVTVLDTTTYYITVTDSIGCTHTDSVKVCGIEVDCGEGNIFIPNVFTPNGDGINDELCFRGEWVKEFHIAIFNRWGELLYESNDLSQCWDGRYKDNWCQPGVYTYTCHVRCEADKVSEFKGDVTIIR